MTARRSLTVQEVNPLKNQRLLLLFSNGHSKVFNVSQHMASSSAMPELMDDAYFDKVSVNESGVEWPNGPRLTPEFLYDYGIRVS